MRSSTAISRNRNDWPFEISGPGMGTAKAPTVGMALSLAQGRACRHDEDEGTWYVREYEDVVYIVERQKDGSVTTRERQ